MKPVSWDVKKLLPLLKKYKLVLLVLAAGLLLLLWPEGGTEPAAVSTGTAGESFDVEALERRMEEVLSRIQGAGEVSVILTVESGMERVLAADVELREENGEREEATSTVIVSTGSSTEEVVVQSSLYPVFRGALVVCDGGDDPQVRLLITQAVAALTGLGTDKIAVCG